MAVFTLSGANPRARTIDYAKELNAEQFAVVEGGDGRVLVLAGAGSGKTRTLVHRVAYLLEHGARDSEILLLTFTNKAAREMMDRVSALLGRQLPELWGGTFHHVCHRILRAEALAAGLTPNFAILDEEDAKHLLKLAIKEQKIPVTERRFPSPAVIKGMSSYGKNASRSLEEVVEERYPQFLDILPDIQRVVRAYEERKRASGALDFDDLLLKTRAVLHESAAVREKYASKFRYVLVDEFQDTNALQSDIVTVLSSHHGNLLVVGDDAQSIYSFRAADIRNILEFPKRFAESKTFRLETNYRSTAEILDLANETISFNTNQFEKDLKTTGKNGEKPFYVPTSSAREEAAFIAEMMLKLRGEGVPMSEMAVLFRATHHSQSLEFELMKRDIPYEYRGGMKFFERSHIKDALAFVRITVSRDDESAWLRVLELGQGIGPAAALKAFSAARGTESVEHAAERIAGVLTNRARTGFAPLAGILLSVARSGGVAAMIRAVADSKYKDILTAEFPNFEERLADLEQMAVFAERYDDVVSFLADVSLQDGLSAARERPGERSDEERVVLSTVHQAKGLEWHTVFVIHLADQYFPNRRAMEEQNGIEEERRLFYVAVTRAKRKLFLSYPVTIGEEHMALVQPSMFLDELSPRLLERMELKYSKKPARSGETIWKDDGWDDEVVELDEFGEKKT